MKAGRISFDDDEWRRVSPQVTVARELTPPQTLSMCVPLTRLSSFQFPTLQAKSLVTQLLQHDPKQRLTAAELVTHPWVRGEDVPVAPLPATHERLSAFIKARAAAFDRLRPLPTRTQPIPTLTPQPISL